MLFDCQLEADATGSSCPCPRDERGILRVLVEASSDLARCPILGHKLWQLHQFAQYLELCMSRCSQPQMPHPSSVSSGAWPDTGALQDESAQLVGDLAAATAAGDAEAAGQALHAIAARARQGPPEMWRRHEVEVRLLRLV